MYHKSLIIQSVIQHLCQFYEPRDSDKRRRLFAEICTSFARMKVFDRAEAEFARPNPLRDQYTRALEKLVAVAHASVRGVAPADAVDGRCPRHALLMPPPQPTPIGYLEGGGAFAFHTSRYATEFEQLEFIAKGTKMAEEMSSCLHNR